MHWSDQTCKHWFSKKNFFVNHSLGSDTVYQSISRTEKKYINVDNWILLGFKLLVKQKRHLDSELVILFFCLFIYLFIFQTLCLIEVENLGIIEYWIMLLFFSTLGLRGVFKWNYMRSIELLTAQRHVKYDKRPNWIVLFLLFTRLGTIGLIFSSVLYCLN